MAGHDEIIAPIGIVYLGRVLHPQLNGQTGVAGLLSGAIKHLRSEVDPGDSMPQFRKQNREHSGTTADIEYLAWRISGDSREHIQPCPLLCFAMHAMHGFLVEPVRTGIPMMLNKSRNLTMLRL